MSFHILSYSEDKISCMETKQGKEIGTRKTTQNQTPTNADLVNGHSFIWLFLPLV